MCRSILRIPCNVWRLFSRMRKLRYWLRSSGWLICFLRVWRRLCPLMPIGRKLPRNPARIQPLPRNPETWLMCYLLLDPRAGRRESLSSIAALRPSFSGRRAFSRPRRLLARCSRLRCVSTFLYSKCSYLSAWAAGSSWPRMLCSCPSYPIRMKLH